MKTIGRFFLLILGPFTAFLTLLMVSGFLANRLTTVDPIQSRVENAIRNHFVEQKNVPVDIFDGNVFIAAKQISKGQKITVDAVERQSFTASDCEAQINPLDQHVIGQSALKNIKRGELISQSLLMPNKGAAAQPINQDQLVKDREVSENATIGIICIATLGILALSGLVAYLVGHILLIVHAFKKSALWGIALFLVPMAEVTFELRHWQLSKRPFQLMMIGCALLGITGGLCLNAKADEQRLSFAMREQALLDKIEEKAPVVYCVKKNQRWTGY